MKAESLGKEGAPLSIVIPESVRRLQDMALIQGQKPQEWLQSYEVVVNKDHALVRRLKDISKDDIKKEVTRLYHWGLLVSQRLKGKALSAFAEACLTDWQGVKGGKKEKKTG